MGGRLKHGASRVAFAAMLTALAILVPSAAWYAAGRHDVEREANQRLAAPGQAARAVARQHARNLAVRLNDLIAAETARPYYHYQNLYHDPRGVSQGVSVVPSPLSLGPADPLIRAYFQIDERGHVTMPTLNDRLSERDLQPDADRQRAIRQELTDAVPAGLALLAVESPKARSRAGESAGRTAPRDEPAQQMQQLDRSSYAQNVQADELYARLKRAQSEPVALESSAASESVWIELGPLRWRTWTIGGESSLAAVRLVSSPHGRWIQGFALSSAGLAEGVGNAAFPARLVPGARVARAAIAERVAGTDWQVVVEPSVAVARARAEGDALRSRFHRGFGFGLLAALLAGAGVVGLVWQSERLARQRSRFAAAAAHELRTPLAGLRIHGEMLAEGLGDPGRARHYARRVADEAERLGRVVGNVLTFTRLERDLLRVNREPGDLAAVVRAAAERQRPSLEAAGVSLSVDLAADLPRVRFDADAVEHIVQNLLDNAERHTREAEDRRVSLSLAGAEDRVEIGVRDHGPGVPVARRAKLFRSFEADPERSASSGLGLGLALVAALARAHGGAVSHQSPADGGACFLVSIPLKG